jgi:hypothetical protein
VFPLEKLVIGERNDPLAKASGLNPAQKAKEK